MLEMLKTAALFVSFIGVIATGLFTLLSNRQKSKLDRELRERVAELDQEMQERGAAFGLMKSAFDLRFKDEFETYKALWPSLQALISNLEWETDGLIEKRAEERTAIIDRDLLPVTERLCASSIFLPREIRKLAETIVNESASWRNIIGHPDLGNPAIFTAPRPIKELVRDLTDLRDMIAKRIDMLPGGDDFGTTSRRYA
ncbi:hypothetical protein [Rhizobium esperanzae]|uniref:Uncharacterized protein n=1 Tax=Rhizobium esperanzae TaxID=1967781 RepID=A0A7W6R166_9HYPH|nr:hypothetical protein [Rhizobium esperanzae]MBB4234858.1 hypothetical protein [Rhizobium esperanzae]